MSMFGNSSVTSSWANPQQNQPQQGTSAFGQPSGFGAGGNAFGQNQQPQANPMFGNLATNPNPTNTGFGAFGSNNNASTSASLFGAPKPATGFGAFGGGPNTTSTFGSTGAFGQNPSSTSGTTGTGLFGQPTTTSAFGATTGTSLFKPASTFGPTSTTAQAGTYDSVPLVTTGSANPPYSVYTEKDASNSSVTLQYQSISCLPAYRGTSFEEIRIQDYAQGRKTAGAFGQSATFGTNPAPATNIFGAPAQTTTQPNTSLFGNTGTGATGFGAFSQPNATQPASTSGTALFGSFGQPQQQQQQPSGFGAFGQNTQQQPAQTGTNPFSNTNTYGANKPASTFGAFGTGGSTFGAFSQQTQPSQPSQPATNTNIFGQQPQPQGTTFSGFAANKPSLFGNPQPAAQNPAAFGAFGQPTQGQQTNPQGGLFGTGNLFNQQAQAQGQQPTQQPGGGIFGNTQPAQPGGLFINTGSFGAGAQPSNAQQGPPQNTFANLFSKPAAPSTMTGGGIFGNFGAQGTNSGTTAPQGQQMSFFGTSPANQQQPAATSNLGDIFGKPAATMIGQPQTNVGQPGIGLGNSLFGNHVQTGSLNLSASAPGAQGSLTASISQPIGANLPIFSMLPPGPQAVTLEQPKKKPGFFVDVPTRSPVPRLQLSYTPASSKLRGFGSSLSVSNLGAGGGGPASNGLSFTSGKPNALSLSRVIDNKTPLGPDALLGRSSSPSLGSGGRQSVKKLILDKKIDPSELFSKSGSPSSQRTGSVTFSPALSIAAREKEASAAARPTESPTPASRDLHTSNRFAAHSTHHVLDTNKQDSTAAKTTNESEPQEGDYWVKPDLETLKHAGYEELLSFKGLTVGRVGYGQIEFLDPVDLTGLSKLGALLGEVVRFDDKECSVYPDVDEVDKPSPGAGLNVRARITLLRCWAQDKATREPIKDEKDPLAIKHVKRLKNMKDTHFESWETEAGKWTFTVGHF